MLVESALCHHRHERRWAHETIKTASTKSYDFRSAGRAPGGSLFRHDLAVVLHLPWVDRRRGGHLPNSAAARHDQGVRVQRPRARAGLDYSNHRQCLQGSAAELRAAHDRRARARRRARGSCRARWHGERRRRPIAARPAPGHPSALLFGIASSISTKWRTSPSVVPRLSCSLRTAEPLGAVLDYRGRLFTDGAIRRHALIASQRLASPLAPSGLKLVLLRSKTARLRKAEGVFWVSQAGVGIRVKATDRLALSLSPTKRADSPPRGIGSWQHR